MDRCKKVEVSLSVCWTPLYPICPPPPPLWTNGFSHPLCELNTCPFKAILVPPFTNIYYMVRWGLRVTPCEHLFYSIVLVLKRTGGWRLTVSISMLWPPSREIKTEVSWSRPEHTDWNAESITTGYFQNHNFWKEMFTWCYRNLHLIILPPCKGSNSTLVHGYCTDEQQKS